ncbi:MAG: hypothetical protein ACJ70Z_04395 [Nitrososphaera sp.]
MSDAQRSVVCIDVNKKGAKGVIDDSDFGEVLEVSRALFANKKGKTSKEEYFHSKVFGKGV